MSSYQKHNNGYLYMQMLIIIFDDIENLYSCPQIISLCYKEHWR